MHIVFYIVQILFVAVVATVLASYAVRRYEVGAGVGEAAGDRLSNAEAALGVAREIGAIFAAIMLYPLGFIMRDTDLTTRARGERPVILCHGYMHNKSAFLLMGHRLRRIGRNNVVTLNFGPPSRRVPFFAERLSEAVKTALAQTGAEKVDLVGHSMGGLVVRYFVERLDGAASVNAAVTLGAPHRGTKTAVFGVFKSAEQFMPDSDLIAELNEAVPANRAVNMSAVWSDFDSVILPSESARLPAPHSNVKVGGVGHVAMLLSGRIFDEVRRATSKDFPQQGLVDGVD